VEGICVQLPVGLGPGLSLLDKCSWLAVAFEELSPKRDHFLFGQRVPRFEMARRNLRDVDAAQETSEERYSELFENANDAIFTVDVLGNFTSANRACEQLTGYERSETASMHFTEIVAPEYLALVRRALERKLAGESSATYELEIIAKDGRRVPLELSSRPIVRKGEVVGVQGIARNITDRRRAREALLRLNETREEEAKRIAHALHDAASQLLVAVQIELADLASTSPPGIKERLRQMSEHLDQVEEHLRRLSHELRPTILDDLGLLPALGLLVEGVSKRTGLPITVAGTTGGRLPPAIETALYRTVQEALTNVRKHAHARLAKVELTRENQAVRCTIWDDGVGFDPLRVLGRQGQRGLGLIGMRERLEPFRGTLDIKSSPHAGTELIVTIPLEAPNPAEVCT
jgi:two-component system sensor histidine kinase UhpB